MSGRSTPLGAFWIGSAHPFDLHEVYLCFRRDFNCDASSATLSITADSRYRLWVNGTFAGRGPARCWPQAQAVDTIDLSPFLRPGRNVLAVQVYQPGYSHFAYVHRGAAGLLAWVVEGGRGERGGDPESAEEDNGSIREGLLMVAAGTIVATDGAWRVRRDPSFAANVPRVSIYGSGVEDRDLRLVEDWQAADYDDGDWSFARVVARPNEYPWTALESRPLPLLVEGDLSMTLLETRAGPAPAAADPHAALAEGWTAAVPFDARSAGEWQGVRQDSGEAIYWLYDLGRDYLCQGWAEIRGAAGGETLLLSYAEKLLDGQLVLPDPTTYCRVRPTDRFRLQPGDQRAEPFLMRGGRYLLLGLLGAADLRLRFGATAAEYPLQIDRRLETDDPLLQDVITLCETTFRACLHDGFVDSVWRESSQWVGDALPQALVMAAMSDDARPLRRVIRMAAQGAYPDGVLPSVLPGQVHAYTVVDYNFTWVELLALDWRLTGDRAFLLEQWPVLAKLLDRFHADLGPDGLIRSQPGRRLFLDWSHQSRAEPSAVYNLHYLLALQVAERLAADLGDEAHACLWNERAMGVKEAVRREFWRDSHWRDDPDGSTHSQLAAALAILTDAAEAAELPALLDALAARSLDSGDDHEPARMVLASPFMHHYVLEALRLNGRVETVIAIVRQRWGRWVDGGYPTAWENWAVDFPDGSQCHAFSAHPRYHLQQIALAHPEWGLHVTSVS